MARNNRNLFSPALEAVSLKSKSQQDCAPSEGLRKESFLASPSSGGPRHSLACDSIAPISASLCLHMASSVCLRVCLLLF